jgi:hypothetical protein
MENGVPIADRDVLKDGMYLFEFPTQTVQSVIVGCLTSGTWLQRAKSLLESDSRYEHVAVTRASLDEREFSLHFSAVPFEHHGGT